MIPDLIICNEQISSTSKAKNLGVILDSALTMEPKINEICKKACWEIRNIGRLREMIDPRNCAILVQAYVTSKLDYCNALLYSCNAKHINKLQRVQNAAARLIACTRKFDPVTLIKKNLHWLPVKQRIVFKIIILCFKALYGKAPEYMQQLVSFKDNGSRRPKYLLKEPVDTTKTLKTVGDRSFAVAAYKLWNDLPKDIRKIDHYVNFKKLLKTHLFKEAYSC